MPGKRRAKYDRAWSKLRSRILARDRLRCYEPTCERPATCVDHIVPVLEAPSLRLVEANCRASCSKHNYGRANSRRAAMARINRAPGTLRQW